MSNAVIYPCTPFAVFRSLESLAQVYNPSAPVGRMMEGKVITVINRYVTLFQVAHWRKPIVL